MKLKKSTINNIISFGIVIIAFIIGQSMISTGLMMRSLKGQMIPICVYIVMAVSLNLVVGISGELSLGHAGFMSIGAFSGIIASAWLNAALHVENEVLRLVLAMIVGKDGEAPRRPGTKMLVKADGHFTGTVGGGSAEARILKCAGDMLREGCRESRTARLTLEKGTMYCGGEITVFMLPL